MITVKDVEKLAQLARIKLEDDEKAGLAKEIDSILAYVDQIKKATVDMEHTSGVDAASLGAVSNVTRPDVPISNVSDALSAAISSANRERIINEAPDREGDFVAVKKIIV